MLEGLIRALDRTIGHIAELFVIGDPRISGEKFGEYTDRLGMDARIHKKAWLHQLAKYGDDPSAAKAFEEDDLTASIDLSIEALPCLVMCAAGKVALGMEVIHIPVHIWHDESSLIRLRDSLTKVLSAESLSPLIRTLEKSGVGQSKALVAIRDHVAEVIRVGLRSILDNLTPTQQDLLSQLGKKQGRRIMTDELARLVGRTRSSVAPDLAELRRRYLIDNLPRRGYWVTEHGLAVLDQGGSGGS
jgi:hypothetical protein